MINFIIWQKKEKHTSTTDRTTVQCQETLPRDDCAVEACLRGKDNEIPIKI